MNHPKPRTQNTAQKSPRQSLRTHAVALAVILGLSLLPYLGHALSRGASPDEQSKGARQAKSAPNFNIRGTVRTEGGAPIADVQIRATGDSGGAIFTTTGSDGKYSLDGLTGGLTYTVTPTKSGLAFTPSSRVFTNLNANEEAADFVGAAGQAFSIKGTVKTGGGAPIADVQVRVTGDSGAILTFTGNDGTYIVNGLTGGRDYTVTPTKSGLAFTPASRVFTNLTANAEGADFTGAAGQAFSIKGAVKTAGGNPVADVQIRVTGDSGDILTFTGNDGSYIVNGLTGGRDYTVTPSKAGLSFSPASRVFAPLGANQEGADFVASTGQVFSVKGTVKDQNGAPVPDVQVRVTGDGTTLLTTTGGDGAYLVNGVVGGRDYTITPVKSGLSFTPTSRTVTNLNANVEGADFTAGGPPATPTPTPTPSPSPTPAAVSIHFDVANLFVAEGTAAVQVAVTREGDASAAVSVDYATNDGTASATSDYNAAYGTLRFEAGETEKSVTVFITDDTYGEGPETFSLTLSGAVGATVGTPSTTEVTVNSDEAADGPNPTRVASFNSEFFVRRHYIDFFNREADAPGLAFWVNEIESCGADAACREVKRINVSAAFFLSSEFQQTGYLVYRAYAAAFGPTRVGSTVPLTLREFLPDTQEIGRGVIVGQPGADALIEANRVAFFNRFVERPSFRTLYPDATSPALFVDSLNANTGGSLSQAERDALVADLTSGAKTRAQVLRAVAEDADFRQREFNRAFVLIQYFGYMRRNPFDPPELTLDFAGYNFWLQKLIDNNGNFVQAEMVKSFITSEEYKKRFGP